MSGSTTGQEVYKRNLENLIVPKSKNIQNKNKPKKTYNNEICKIDIGSKRKSCPMAEPGVISVKERKKKNEGKRNEGWDSIGLYPKV